MKLISPKTDNFREIFLCLIEAIFFTSLVAYLAFFLLENIKEGFVSNYLNINIILWLGAISGILFVWLKPSSDNISKIKTSRKDYLFIIFGALSGGIIIWLKTKEMGLVSYVIGLITVIIVIILSIILLKEDKNKRN